MVRRNAEGYVPVAINVVVECQLLILLDIAMGKDAHAHVLPHRPLSHIAIRIAAVISKSTDAATFGGIDKLGNLIRGRSYSGENDSLLRLSAAS